MDKLDVVKKIQDIGVVSVVRGKTPEEAIMMSEACIKGDVTAIELAFTTPRAHEVIEALSKKYADNPDVIIGAKTKSMLIYTEEMARVADNLYIATDDGSEGFKGMVTALIKDLIDNRGKQYDVCVAIGPMIMMKFVTLTTKEYSLPTVVSLNTLMVDGTGMCGACRVTVGGKTVFTCVDGPEFDGFQVDFDEAMRRQGMYRTQEERARAIEQERENGHKCRVGLDK
jgi:ferredoxin--NADP+ reductase